MTDPRSDLAALLGPWLPGQRWFAHKGHAAADVEVVGELALDDGDVDDDVDVRLLVLGVAGARYQVPVTLRAQPEPGLAEALVGVLPDGRHVYDGPRDPQFVRRWLALLTASDDAVGTALRVRAGRPQEGLPIDPAAPAHVLRGEQSNTSVIVGADTPNPMIVKLFRVLAAGNNPDVVVQTALAEAGCRRVAAPGGWLQGWWPADPSPDGEECGHLAYACEFLPGSEDAWRVAVRAVTDGRSFADQARALGAATAEVHTVLAKALPTIPATPALLAGLADGLLGRVDWAAEHAPQLAPLATAARAAVDAVRDQTSAPALQQVHGDYHLGQVLHSPDRGWILLDFEGEPLRPLVERTAPDLALRDVAGMLRSFDYAARQATVDLPESDPAVDRADAWAREAREAFLDGYAGQAGHDPREDGVLLRALELDKALYEVVYETRNRPTWVPIPMGAVHRLLGR